MMSEMIENDFDHLRSRPTNNCRPARVGLNVGVNSRCHGNNSWANRF